MKLNQEQIKLVLYVSKDKRLINPWRNKMKLNIVNIDLSTFVRLYLGTDPHLGNGGPADNAVLSQSGLVAASKKKHWTWIWLGDVYETWQFGIKVIMSAWGYIAQWLFRVIRVKGNHDMEMSKSPEMIIAKWGSLTIGFVHDPTFKYKGKRKRFVRWLVKYLWTPIEKMLGWHKGQELSSALNNKDRKPLMQAAYNLAVKYNLDLIAYGHDHGIPFVKKIKKKLVCNAGTFQDGRNEFIRIERTHLDKVKHTIMRFKKDGKIQQLTKKKWVRAYSKD